MHPFDSFDQNVYAVLGQETAHRWGSALRFKDPRNGQVSKKLLGRDNSHWAAFVDTDASVMDGWDFRHEQKRDPRLAEIPVITVSATLKVLDVDAQFLKPLDFEKFLVGVRRHVQPSPR